MTAHTIAGSKTAHRMRVDDRWRRRDKRDPRRTLRHRRVHTSVFCTAAGFDRSLLPTDCRLYRSAHGAQDPSGETGQPQVARALEELDIELICAATPQAKGRVERAHQTLQHRLLREMRLRNISDIENATPFYCTSSPNTTSALPLLHAVTSMRSGHTTNSTSSASLPRGYAVRLLKT